MQRALAAAYRRESPAIAAARPRPAARGSRAARALGPAPFPRPAWDRERRSRPARGAGNPRRARACERMRPRRLRAPWQGCAKLPRRRELDREAAARRRKHRASRDGLPGPAAATCANWPSISTSISPSWRSRPMLAGWSSMKARLRPSALTTRRSTTMSFSEAMPASSSRSRARDGSCAEIEFGGHRRLLGAGAHQAALGAHAERQPERVEQDRFAGAGLAGQDAQARPEGEIKPVDQHDIANGKAEQHRGR